MSRVSTKIIALSLSLGTSLGFCIATAQAEDSPQTLKKAIQVGSLTLNVMHDNMATTYNIMSEGRDDLYKALFYEPTGLASADPKIRVSYRLVLPEGIEETKHASEIKLSDEDKRRWRASLVRKMLQESHMAVAYQLFAPFGDLKVIKQGSESEASIRTGVVHDTNSLLAIEATDQIDRLLRMEIEVAVSGEVVPEEKQIDIDIADLGEETLGSLQLFRQATLAKINDSNQEFKDKRKELIDLLAKHRINLVTNNILHEVLEQAPEQFEAAEALLREMQSAMESMAKQFEALIALNREIDFYENDQMRAEERIEDAEFPRCRFCTENTEGILTRVPGKYRVGAPEVTKFSRRTYLSEFEGKAVETSIQTMQIVYPIYLRSEEDITTTLVNTVPSSGASLGIQDRALASARATIHTSGAYGIKARRLVDQVNQAAAEKTRGASGE